MGTSGSFSGSKQALVPSWVDDDDINSPVSQDSPDTAPSDNPTELPDQNPAGLDSQPYPAMPTPKIGMELGPARGNITRGTRSRDAASLKRGTGRYVGASGGAAGASRRMSSSRKVAAGIVQVAQAFNAGGVANVIQTFNLQGLAGASVTEVFVALTDVLCPAGGTIDEAIARDAMLETIVDLVESGVTDFDDLTPEQLQEFFIGVVARSIEDKIWNELGTNSFGRADDIETIERAESNLHDFVDGCVRDQFDNAETSLENVSVDEINDFVSELYTAAFDMMMILGERE